MRTLEVRLLRAPGDKRVVGRLAETCARTVGQRLVFEYDPAFLRDPLCPTSTTLPHRRQLHLPIGEMTWVDMTPAS
jgi:hypothetical protein